MVGLAPNALKSDPKKPQICPIWGQSDPLWSQTYHPWSHFVPQSNIRDMSHSCVPLEICDWRKDVIREFDTSMVPGRTGLTRAVYTT